MGRIDKTVFISYRNTNQPWALAIYQHLIHQGFNVFFDYNILKSGDFEQVITENIRGRTHFVVLLTPSALERCNEPGDQMRREIELALDEKRNIVPLFFEGFSFSSPSISKYLTDRLDLLKKHKEITLSAEYFDAAMARLCNDFLNVPFAAILHPLSDTVENAVKMQQAAARKAKKIQHNELAAQEWFEQGKHYDDSNDFDECINSYTKAIGLKSDYVEAYLRRGVACHEKGDMDGALKDTNEAIRLNPDFAEAHFIRGRARYYKSDVEGAIQDYNKAIRLNPEYALAYYNRGIARSDKGDLAGAIKDYGEAIRFSPDYALAYYNRGIARGDKGDLAGAIKDYSETIRLSPEYADAYNNRAILRSDKGDLAGALEDYNEAIRLNPSDADAYINRGILWEEYKNNYDAAIADFQRYIDLGGERKEVAEWVTDLKKKSNSE
ncbi:MAG TPA: tetratricopeptide repeat protein [Anaerolineales bacterium]|nr:tetratricopeptide repeat protein [Anaerolineales bacterium]